MRDHDAGHAHLLDDADQLELGALAQFFVERAQGLVQQQQTRPLGQATRQRHPLLLAAGKLMRLAFGVGLELHQVQHASHALLDLGLGQVVTPQAKGHVVPHTQVGEQRVALEHHVDRPLVGRQPDDVPTLQHNLTRGRHLKARQHAQQGRLAAARRAQQRKNFTLLDVERHIIHSKHIVVLFDDAFDLQKRGRTLPGLQAIRGFDRAHNRPVQGSDPQLITGRT